MEPIGECKFTIDEFLEAKNKYLELKWKLILEDYTNEEEKEKIVKKKNKLNKKYEIEDEDEEKYEIEIN